MPYTVSFHTQRNSILYYKELIKGLEYEVWKERCGCWPRFQQRFNSLSSNLQSLSMQISESSMKQDIDDLTVRFMGFKQRFEQKCVVMLSRRVEDDIMRISKKDVHWFFDCFHFVNPHLQIHQKEICFLSTHLPAHKEALEKIRKSLLEFVENTNKKLQADCLKLDTTALPMLTQTCEWLFSKKAQSLSIRLFKSQIKDLSDDIENDPDCRLPAYRERVQALDWALCQKTSYDSEDYCAQRELLKIKVAKVRLVLEDRCILAVIRQLDHMDLTTKSKVKGVRRRIEFLSKYISQERQPRVHWLIHKMNRVEKNMNYFRSSPCRMSLPTELSLSDAVLPLCDSSERVRAEDVDHVIRRLQSIVQFDEEKLHASLENEKILDSLVFFDMTQTIMSIKHRIFFHARSKLNAENIRSAIERTRSELMMFHFILLIHEHGYAAAIKYYNKAFKAMGIHTQFWGLFHSFCKNQKPHLAAYIAAKHMLISLRQTWGIRFQILSEKEEEKMRTGSLKPGSTDFS